MGAVPVFNPIVMLSQSIHHMTTKSFHLIQNRNNFCNNSHLNNSYFNPKTSPPYIHHRTGSPPQHRQSTTAPAVHHSTGSSPQQFHTVNFPLTPITAQTNLKVTPIPYYRVYDAASRKYLNCLQFSLHNFFIILELLSLIMLILS